MPRLPAMTIPAPSGFNTTSDPALLPENRGQYLQNVFGDHPGVLRSNIQNRPLVIAGTLTKSVDGMGIFYGVTVNLDWLILVENAQIWVETPVLDGSGRPLFPPQWGNRTILTNSSGVSLPVGKRYRMATFNNEVVIVADGGLQPLRWKAGDSAFYQLGVNPPSTPNLSDAGGGTKSGGTYRYVATLQDNNGNRESSISAAASITIAANHNVSAVINTGTDPQVAKVALYCQPPGATSFYLILATASPGVSQNVTITDTLTDAQITANAIASQAGENDVPHTASCVAVHKQRVVLNDTTQSAGMQLSNLNSATQFASTIYQATDGVRLTIPGPPGDTIQNFAVFGSLLGIAKRYAIHSLWGDTANDFLTRPLHEKGCIAPDSFARCDDALLWLSDDDVYSTSFDGAFRLGNVSAEIQTLIDNYAVTSGGRSMLEVAQSAYALRHYFLAVGTILYAFSFDAKGWTTLVLQ